MKEETAAATEEAVININMRCIEITIAAHFDGDGFTININMRCIEMILQEGQRNRSTPININMRCIEIRRVLIL